MQIQRLVIIFTALLSLALLIPGITKPMISLRGDMDQQALINEGKKLISEQKLHPAMISMANKFLSGLNVEGKIKLYDKTRSILGTAEDLWKSGYLLVAILIVVFSIIIPSIKTLLQLIACAVKNNNRLIDLNSFLSRWSMPDVFAIGVIIACLAANGSSSQKAPLMFSADLHSGFYWFVAYCLASIAAGQLVSSLSSTTSSTVT